MNRRSLVHLLGTALLAATFSAPALAQGQQDFSQVKIVTTQVGPNLYALDGQGGRMGVALDSIVCGGCIISGGRVQTSVLSPNVRVQDHADVRESVIMENVVIGEHCRIRRAIIDKDVDIPPKTEIGYDRAADAQRFNVTESGIVVVSG